MYEYLRTHPSVYMPSEEKEPHFYSTDIPDYCYGRYRRAGDYESLFAAATSNELIGEASVFYLHSSQAIPRILNVNPDAKFIAMIRNPADMAYSLYSQLRWAAEEDAADFETAWNLQKPRLDGLQIPATCCEPSLLQYRSVCSLGTQLRRLFDLVPTSQRLVIVLDDMEVNPRTEYLRVLSFLGLTDDGRDSFERINSNTVARSQGFARLLHFSRKHLGASLRTAKAPAAQVWIATTALPLSS